MMRRRGAGAHVEEPGGRLGTDAAHVEASLTQPVRERVGPQVALNHEIRVSLWLESITPRGQQFQELSPAHPHRWVAVDGREAKLRGNLVRFADFDVVRPALSESE